MVRLVFRSDLLPSSGLLRRIGQTHHAPYICPQLPSGPCHHMIKLLLSDVLRSLQMGVVARKDLSEKPFFLLGLARLL